MRKFSKPNFWLTLYDNSQGRRHHTCWINPILSIWFYHFFSFIWFHTHFRHSSQKSLFLIQLRYFRTFELTMISNNSLRVRYVPCSLYVEYICSYFFMTRYSSGSSISFSEWPWTIYLINILFSQFTKKSMWPVMGLLRINKMNKTSMLKCLVIIFQEYRVTSFHFTYMTNIIINSAWNTYSIRSKFPWNISCYFVRHKS